MRATTRIVSLVPSLTETVAVLGLADRLVGVTKYCVHGVPAGVERIGGTKNPDVERIVALRPDVVLANTEENRPRELTALRAAGVDVWETFPRTVADVPPMLASLGDRLGAMAATEPLLARLQEAERAAAARRPPIGVPALTLVWRRPWMAVGPDTFVDDLLGRCGFVNVVAGRGERYPRLEVGDPELERTAAVLLPSEPYAFGDGDLDAVRKLVGNRATCRFVDGQMLTWHGQRTAKALLAFTELARELVASR